MFKFIYVYIESESFSISSENGEGEFGIDRISGYFFLVYIDYCL